MRIDASTKHQIITRARRFSKRARREFRIRHALRMLYGRSEETPGRYATAQAMKELFKTT